MINAWFSEVQKESKDAFGIDPDAENSLYRLWLSFYERGEVREVQGWGGGGRWVRDNKQVRIMFWQPLRDQNSSESVF